MILVPDNKIMVNLWQLKLVSSKTTLKSLNSATANRKQDITKTWRKIVTSKNYHFSFSNNDKLSVKYQNTDFEKWKETLNLQLIIDFILKIFMKITDQFQLKRFFLNI